MISLWSAGFNCWTSVAPAFQSWFAVEYSSCFISVMNRILIYMFAVLIHLWINVLHADRTSSMCIWTTAEHRVRLLQRKTDLSRTPPPVIYYWPFQGHDSVVGYSNCQCIIHRSNLQSVLLANLYFNYDQSLLRPTEVQLLDFCCSSISELWVILIVNVRPLSVCLWLTVQFI